VAEALKEVPGYPDEAPKVEIFDVIIPKMAAKAAVTMVAAVSPFAGRIGEVSYTPVAEVAESATEYGVYELVVYNVKGEEVGVAAKYSTKEGAGKKEKLAAFVTRQLTLEAAEKLEVTAGSILVFKLVSTESKEDKGGILAIKLYREVKKTPKEQPGV